MTQPTYDSDETMEDNFDYSRVTFTFYVALPRSAAGQSSPTFDQERLQRHLEKQTGAAVTLPLVEIERRAR